MKRMKGGVVGKATRGLDGGLDAHYPVKERDGGGGSSFV